MLLVVAGLIERDGKTLVAQRPAGSWREGAWEFPGGKVEPDEDPREALVRELSEELGIVASAGDIEEVLFHRYPDRTVLLLFYRCSIREGEPEGKIGQELVWVSPEAMSEMDLLEADRPLIERLIRERVGRGGHGDADG